MPFDYFVEWHSFYIWLTTIRKIILCVLDIWGFTLKNRVVNNGLLCCPRLKNVRTLQCTKISDTMVYFGVDLYRFSLICNDCFRKVVYKKEKGDEQIVLTPSISESNIKFLKISSLFPPDAYSTGLSYIPNCGCKCTALF